jgi:hypothetical protein
MVHVQKGKKHSEINLVYELEVESPDGTVNAVEDWIEFEWRDLRDLDAANLLPEAFRVLKVNPKAEFKA